MEQRWDIYIIYAAGVEALAEVEEWCRGGGGFQAGVRKCYVLWAGS